MSATKMKIPDDVVPILARSTIAGNVLTLPEQLDRETYLRVAKILTAARGKWDRKAKVHVFPFDPRELIGEAVESGAAIDAKKTLQFFQTPDALARRMVELANLKPGDTALEPSAGLGRIVRHLIAVGAEVLAIEIDGTNAAELRAIDGNPMVQHMDFEDWHADSPAPPGLYHAVVMNPPFSKNRDINHIRAAWEHVLPGGRLVAVCSEGPFFRQDTAARMFRDWLNTIGAKSEKLPPDTFRESGTDVNARLITATNAAPADPDQPRKTFDYRDLSELPASSQAPEMRRGSSMSREATRDRLAASLARLNATDPKTFQDDARFVLDALPAVVSRSDQVKQFRQTILNLAVRGTLVPQDMGDEPVAKRYQNEAGTTYLPANWRVLNFGKFCDIESGNQPPKSQFINEPREGYVQLFQIRDYGERGVPTYIPIASARSLSKEGDILIGRYCAGSIGKVFWAQNGAYNVAMVKFIWPRDALVPNFVFLLLKSDFLQEPLANATRSVQAGFNKGDLAKIDFPLPPLAEQHRIVAKVDELMALCDRLEAARATFA